jgi:hypothetical protein
MPPELPRFCARERTVVRQANGLAFSSFNGPSGDSEHTITIEAPGELSLPRQLDVIAQRYAEAMQALRLPPESAIFRRLYLSDAANQATLVRDSSLFQEPLDSPVAVSLVQQPPLPGGKVAMLAYHLDSPTPLTKRRVPPGHVIVEKRGLGHLWSTRLCATNTDRPSPAADQTREVFGRLIDVLADNGAGLAENCVRTWIYVKDVDVFYQEINDARSALFEQHGLTRDTHYIASTGIEGACAHRYDVVLMDAYSILGLQPAQVSYLSAYDRLCATKDYNVTFERGTRIAYADRAHHLRHRQHRPRRPGGAPGRRAASARTGTGQRRGAAALGRRAARGYDAFDRLSARPERSSPDRGHSRRTLPRDAAAGRARGGVPAGLAGRGRGHRHRPE